MPSGREVRTGTWDVVVVPETSSLKQNSTNKSNKKANTDAQNGGNL